MKMAITVLSGFLFGIGIGLAMVFWKVLNDWLNGG